MIAALLHELLTASAARNPGGPAVVDGARSVSYATLDAWSTAVAWALLDHGVQRGDRVGILAAKSPEAVAGIYGILKVGACYVPCDPAAPPARTSAIMRDCDLRVACIGAAQVALAAELAAAGAPLGHLVLLDGPQPDGAATGPEPSPVTGPHVTTAGLGGPDRGPMPGTGADTDLAYILYTSGSTGQPKGVMLTHRNALAFVGWAVAELGLRPGDRLSSHAPFHFDLSVLDLFGAAAAAAPVWLVPAAASVFPARLASFIRDSGVTIWYSAPSVLTMLVSRGGVRQGDFPALRAVLFAGEVFPVRFLRQLAVLLPHTRFGNLYGPTETNVCTAYWLPRPPKDDEDIPIGTAISGTEAFIAPGSGAASPESGELWVRGATVARGYWGDPERTSERFVPDPRSGHAPGIAYRTGDLARRRDDGNFLFLGRLDSQIKSRGHRIELGEIETALRRHPGVRDAAVLAVPDDLFTNLIKACAAVQPGTGEDDLRSHCAALLPPYMIPDIIEVRAELPRTSTGKIDRRSLVGAGGHATANAGGT